MKSNIESLKDGLNLSTNQTLSALIFTKLQAFLKKEVGLIKLELLQQDRIIKTKEKSQYQIKFRAQLQFKIQFYNTLYQVGMLKWCQAHKAWLLDWSSSNLWVKFSKSKMSDFGIKIFPNSSLEWTQCLRLTMLPVAQIWNQMTDDLMVSLVVSQQQRQLHKET